MRKKNRSKQRISWCAGVVVLLLASEGMANDSCHEWKREHSSWMTEVVRLYLGGAPQAELDSAMFELLQREAYLTSCDVSVQKARGEMVSWRLLGRTPDEYGSAVLETVLDCSGFELDLRQRFESSAADAFRPERRYGWSSRGTR